MTEPFGTEATPASVGSAVPTSAHGPAEGVADAAGPVVEAGAESAGSVVEGVAEAARSVVEGGAEAADRDVTAALADLDAASDRPPAEQIPAYTKVHQTLQATLARIDDD